MLDRFNSKVNLKFLVHLGTSIFVVVGLWSCATRYRFISQPEGATVYHRQGSQEALLGTTPSDVEKSGLPDSQPFFIIYKKPGFAPLEILISPTDQSLTTVFGQLKTDPLVVEDPLLKRSRRILKLVFKIQEHAVQNQMTDALALIKQLEVEEPHLAETYILKGSLYCAIDDKTQCAAAWEKAIALDPDLDPLKIRLKQINDQIAQDKVPKETK